MIRWYFAALGAFVVLAACLPGVRIAHGTGLQRRQRPIRRGERVFVAAIGLFCVWLALRHVAR